MITGKDLIESGWPEGKIIGLALKAAESVQPADFVPFPESPERFQLAVLDLLDVVRQDPRRWLAVSNEDVKALAREVMYVNSPESREDRLRDVPEPFNVFGRELIEDVAFEQMRTAMRLPVAAAGALMPDAHLGYGVPVGAVFATKDAVVPWAVGVDIACRMKLSVFKLSSHVLGQRKSELKDILLRSTNFGAGGKFKDGRREDHPVLEDPAWQATDFLRGLKDTAVAQLGTSGSGNHFVEWGIFEVNENNYEDLRELWPSPDQDFPRRTYLSILSHSGSRGVGYKIANRYSKIAKRRYPKVGEMAWLDLGTEEAEEYWLSMQLAGRYASANHEVIHKKMARALGHTPAFVVENHHNFAWMEQHQGEDLVVHRKGATPAGEGEYGVIPGSMADPGYVVLGKGNAHSLRSASHGAGRTMSRKRAFESITERQWKDTLKKHGLSVIGGSMDEAPQAYKRLDHVMRYQDELISSVGKFTPVICRMDDEKPRSVKRRQTQGAVS